MPTTSRRNHRQSKAETPVAAEVRDLLDEDNVKEMAHDATEYLTDYARQKPGTAALICLGIGFVLGWKLKPW